MSRGLDTWRTSGTWELTLAFITECTVWLEERDLALEVRPHLEPLSGSNLVLGPMIASFGAADRYLGGIESLLDPTRADRLLAGCCRARSSDGRAPAPGL